MTTSVVTCPDCGAPLVAGEAPEQLCPRCLLGMARRSESLVEEQFRHDGEVLDALVGRTLEGKYRVERLLGRGGMGAVFLATHLGTERPVAVKVLAPRLTEDVEFVTRFKREAKAAGRLRHPNIVNVTDFGFAEADGEERLAYLVMEYLDGMSLAEHLERKLDRPLSWVADVVEQIGVAVDEAHRQGVIHRDLKPGNIWLVPDGRGGHLVKVLDFGLAKLGEAHTGADGAASGFDDGHPTLPFVDVVRSPSQMTSMPKYLESDASGEVSRAAARARAYAAARAAETPGPRSEIANLTRVGSVLGTPLYMSPEQGRGDEIDGRSDVYSLGVIAYELLVGKTPFAGDTEALLRQHSEREPSPPSLIRSAIPESVDIALMPALAKRPEDRPASAAAFAAGLRAALETCAEEPGSIIGQAFAIYGANFGTFLKLSSVSGVVPCAVAAALAISTFPAHSMWVFGLIVTAMTTAGLLVGGAVNAGVVTPLVASLTERPGARPRLLDALPRLRRGALRYLLTAFAPRGGVATIGLLVFWPCLLIWDDNWVWILVFGATGGSAMAGNVVELTITGAVAVLEDRSVRGTLQRSRELAKRIGEVYQCGLVAGEVLILGIVMIGAAVTVAAVASLAGAGPAAYHVELSAPVRNAMYAWVAVTAGASLLLNPVVGISFALKYLKARRLGGEDVHDTYAHLSVEENLYGAGRDFAWPDGREPVQVAALNGGFLSVAAVVLAFGWIALVVGLLFVDSPLGFVFLVLTVPLAFFVLVSAWPGNEAGIVLTWRGVRQERHMRNPREFSWSSIRKAVVSQDGKFISLYADDERIQLHGPRYRNSAEVRAYALVQLRRHGKIL